MNWTWIEKILGSPAYCLVWLGSLLLIYFLRRKEIEQLCADYQPARAIWATVLCSDIILWASWYVGLPFGLWLFLIAFFVKINFVNP